MDTSYDLKNVEESAGSKLAFLALNLGCGSRFRSGWVNVDINCTDPKVLHHDLARPFPLESGTFDFVYHSHVIEHFRRQDVSQFLNECRRVLKPGGILRVVVPDLEQIARQYLQLLEQAMAGNSNAASDYEWIMLELYDQAVRETPGGEMKRYLSSSDLQNVDFVLQRIGEEGRRIIDANHRHYPACESPSELSLKSGLAQRLRSLFDWHRWLPSAWRQRAVRWLLGEEGCRALEVGNFRLAGEVHQWMYDRFSLKRLLLQHGFVDVVPRNAFQSYWPDWSEQQLDTKLDGSIYKPDSFFMEARKPGCDR